MPSGKESVNEMQSINLQASPGSRNGNGSCCVEVRDSGNLLNQNMTHLIHRYHDTLLTHFINELS